MVFSNNISLLERYACELQSILLTANSSIGILDERIRDLLYSKLESSPAKDAAANILLEAKRRGDVVLLNSDSGELFSCPPALWEVHCRMPKTPVGITWLIDHVCCENDTANENIDLLQDIISAGIALRLFSTSKKPKYDERRLRELKDVDPTGPVLQHVLKRIEASTLKTDPFPHIYIEDVFPKDYYLFLLDYFPGSNQMGHPMTGYPDRAALFLSNSRLTELNCAQAIFWEGMRALLIHPAFQNCILEKFTEYVSRRLAHRIAPKLTQQIYLTQDQKNYQLRPHTGHLRKLISLRFNFPPDDGFEQFGTSIFKPVPEEQMEDERNQYLRRNGGYELSPRFEFEKFAEVGKAAFRPNSVFGFFHNATSFHGVKIITADTKRNGMQYSLIIENFRDVFPELEEK